MSTTNSVEILDSEGLKSYHSLENLSLDSDGISKDKWQTNSWEMLTQTQRTRLTPRANTTQSQILDAAETRGQITEFNGRGSWKHHHGTLKKKNEIRTSAFSNSSMEISWKRKKGGGEKEGSVRKGNTSKLSVRNFVIVFLSLTQVEAS